MYFLEYVAKRAKFTSDALASIKSTRCGSMYQDSTSKRSAIWQKNLDLAARARAKKQRTQTNLIFPLSRCTTDARIWCKVLRRNRDEGITFPLLACLQVIPKGKTSIFGIARCKVQFFYTRSTLVNRSASLKFCPRYRIQWTTVYVIRPSLMQSRPDPLNVPARLMISEKSAFKNRLATRDRDSDHLRRAKASLRFEFAAKRSCEFCKRPI